MHNNLLTLLAIVNALLRNHTILLPLMHTIYCPYSKKKLTPDKRPTPIQIKLKINANVQDTDSGVRPTLRHRKVNTYHLRQPTTEPRLAERHDHVTGGIRDDVVRQSGTRVKPHAIRIHERQRRAVRQMHR